MRKLRGLCEFCEYFVNSGLRKILHKLKLLYLFDKHFDFLFLKRTFDAFDRFYFANAFSENKDSLDNFKKLLFVAKSVIEKDSNENSLSESVLKSNEYSALLLNFDIFQNDLRLFSQELAVLEQTITTFLSQLWMLKTQVSRNLETYPLFSRETSRESITFRMEVALLGVALRRGLFECRLFIQRNHQKGGRRRKGTFQSSGTCLSEVVGKRRKNHRVS